MLEPAEEWMEKEFKQHQVIEKAVDTADRIICHAADGDRELLALYTVLVAQRFLDKVQIMTQTEVRRKEMDERMKEIKP